MEPNHKLVCIKTEQHPQNFSEGEFKLELNRVYYYITTTYGADDVISMAENDRKNVGFFCNGTDESSYKSFFIDYKEWLAINREKQINEIFK